MNLENESTNHYLSSQSNNQNSPSKPNSHKKKTKRGRKKFKETRHPIYKGVRQRNNGNKWVCEILEPNKKKSRIWLGTYPTPEMAAIAHDVAVLALHGTSAMFNFPDSVSLLPVSKSTSPEDIRETATEFANTASSSSFVNNLSVVTKPCLSKAMFFDEEVLFNMPGFLNSMAEGLLITPPSMKSALDWDNVDCEMDLTLWTE
ncbi:dehydration-responsive element-binding protein 1F [Medicago truncatula]|uniref:dehydration-responsive element-binding protein 1F n=1 Tax=Medicago truncatula TaxID=3880 RepID=UPI001967A17F|nr:dehydration-responsive element-binding protein 1F [Medicago truncatula]